MCALFINRMIAVKLSSSLFYPLDIRETQEEQEQDDERVRESERARERERARESETKTKIIMAASALR